ncbi:MAG: GyrI-like domain-containing protein [Devosia sp.]
MDGALPLDLKRINKSLFTASANIPVFVDVPGQQYLMIDGAGDPNKAPAFNKAIEALYGVAYGLKFALKRLVPPQDFVVMPLEGLWWADDMTAFNAAQRDQWRWTLMIMLPDFVRQIDVTEALAGLRHRKPDAAIDGLRLERWTEGPSVQVLHVGPFDAEALTIRKLHQYVAAQGRTMRGKHHEIYLSNMQRTAPEKLKTILRQPVASRTPAD